MLYIVGFGPGGYETMTVEAVRALEDSDLIVGYTTYVDLIRPWFPEKEFLATAMKQEKERCLLAIQKEEDGRKLFLLYLRPIINGTGNYYIEAQTRDQKRTDVIVDYLGKQYIVELKIWRGEEYNTEGEKQIAEYLDYYHLDKGYLLSFNFNKNKQPGMKTIQVNGKTVVEAVV